MVAESSLPEGETGEAGPEPVLLARPADGVPAVVDTARALDETIGRFALGTGPTALDAERASGYRYSQRAYLVQLRREGAGTSLIDPIACPDLSGLDAALADSEWVLHAATQDLPCLAEVGMHPRRLFDTELAGRLLGYPRVSLAHMTERMLGIALEKGHGAADWSMRPLPEAWLNYAALDVELLVALRDSLADALEEAGKTEWAAQEFEALLSFTGPRKRSDPWRRTSGIHRIRNPRQLAAVRSLWQTRDEIAQRRDVAPGRVLRDAAMVELALAAPKSLTELRRSPALGNRDRQRLASRWWDALTEARELSKDELPENGAAGDGPPPTNRWASRDPEAAARLAAARSVLSELAEKITMPVENVLPPDAVRRLAWQPPEPITAESVEHSLREAGARPWQIELTGSGLTNALTP